MAWTLASYLVVPYGAEDVAGRGVATFGGSVPRDLGEEVVGGFSFGFDL